MRIALFSECYSPIVNGVVVAVATLRRELLRPGHQVYLFAPRYPGHQDDEPNIFRWPSISLPTNPRYPLGVPILPKRFLRRIEDFSPEVIHTHSLFGMGRVATRVARRLKIPLILTYHTLLEDYSHYIPLPKPIVRRLARRLSRNFSNRADFVIAPGPAALNVLRSYGVTSPIEVIPTGADLFLAQGDFTAPISARWQIPPGAPVVAFVGRIAREKNLELLLEAFAQVNKRITQAQLLLIGAGPWQEEVLRFAARLGLTEKVHVTGFLPHHEVFHTLAHAQVFAFPSLTDTQGIVVLEAMACGLPAVAVQSGAVAGILREGEEGLLPEPEPAAFAAALLCLLEDEALRGRMGAKARLRAQEFSSAICAARVTELYRQVIAARRARIA